MSSEKDAGKPEVTSLDTDFFCQDSEFTLIWWRVHDSFRKEQLKNDQRRFIYEEPQVQVEKCGQDDLDWNAVFT